ncbi:MAG: OmpA family protein [Clostridia bacterium]|nr:OmpA family protein [Clostridia bacterium]
MRIRQRMSRSHRRGRPDGANWLSFSDLMSSLLLIFILIMFYIMYQYFDMYEINMAEIARQQYDLDQANADLNEKTEKLSEAEEKMLAQQIRLNAAQKDLEDAEGILAQQQKDLATAQSLLDEKEQEITSQKTALDALSAQLSQQQVKLDEQQKTVDAQQVKLNEQQNTMNAQQVRLDEQQKTVDEQQVKLDEQQIKLNEQQLTMNAQQVKLDEQQLTLEQQQVQIEQLVGLKTRIISSLSDALRAAHISAQVDPSNGSIALESDVLFATNKFELTEQGQAFIDQFLPVYLNVLLSEDYRPYVTEIIIEGHTDSDGDYITNLKLSQQRALAVASYVLADDYYGISAGQKKLLRSLATANGRSWSDLVYVDGVEDKDASRRVVFKFRMTDEQMIQQLKNILETEGE